MDLYSIKEEARLLNRDWEEYFGNNAPFEPYVELPPEDDRTIRVKEVAIEIFDSMDNEAIELKEKKILLRRILRDQDETMCTEFIVWGDSGCKERSSSKRFELKTIVRIPAQVIRSAVSSDGDKVYAVLLSGPLGRFKLVYQFSLSHPNTVDEHYYVQPECSFSAENLVTAIHPIGKNHVLIGTDAGTIEMWDCTDKSVPNRIKTLRATNAFQSSMTMRQNSIASLLIDPGRSQNIFVSLQLKEKQGVITLWQRSFQNGGLEEADYQMMVKIKYDRIIHFACSGYYLMILTYDRFGILYLDIYHLLGSRYVINKYDDVSLPKGIEITALHPKGGQQIQFANRINLRHSVDINYGMSPKPFTFDINDRFVVIEASEGLTSNNGQSKSFPGLIVILY